MKYVYLIGDGMADEPLEELENKTPLEVAFTPNIDLLLFEGKGGMLKTVPDGITPGSDVANMSLLGYSPAKYYTGRSPLEAIGNDIELTDDNVVFRMNFVTIEDGIMIDFSAGHVTNEEAEELIGLLNKNLSNEEFSFFKGVSYRNLMVTNKKYLHLTSTPPHDIMGQSIALYLPKGDNAEVIIDIMEKSRKILLDSDVNKRRRKENKRLITDIWLWGHGVKPVFKPDFRQKYGLKGIVIAGVDLIKGIGKAIGFSAPNIKGATGYLDTNYEAKADALLQNWHKYDFFFLHVEAPDEAGHMGDIEKKIDAIEKFDKYVVGTILDRIYDRKSNVRIVITPDHATPIKKRTHTNAEVPFVIWGANVVQDNSIVYNEEHIKNNGSLNYKTPVDLIDDVIKKETL